jgi:hypothetical protein
LSALRQRYQTTKKQYKQSVQERRATYVNKDEAAMARLRRQSKKDKNHQGEPVSRSVYIPVESFADGSGGPSTWRQAAQILRDHEGLWALTGPDVQPPSTAAFHDAKALGLIDQFHGFLDCFLWATCAHCWKAWFSMGHSFSFASADILGPHGLPQRSPWFDVAKSKILARWAFDGVWVTDASLFDTCIKLNPGVMECSCGALGVLPSGDGRCP